MFDGGWVVGWWEMISIVVGSFSDCLCPGFVISTTTTRAAIFLWLRQLIIRALKNVKFWSRALCLKSLMNVEYSYFTWTAVRCEYWDGPVWGGREGRELERTGELPALSLCPTVILLVFQFSLAAPVSLKISNSKHTFSLSLSLSQVKCDQIRSYHSQDTAGTESPWRG